MAVALAPVVLGVLGVLVGMSVARRLGASGSPWVRGRFAGRSSRLVSVGRFARVDHHVAEVLAMAALAAWTLAERRGWRWEAAGAAIIAAAVLSFTGSTLYVAIALAMLAVQRTSMEGVAAAIGGALISAAFVPAAVAEHGHAWSYVFPSWLQPALVGCGGVWLRALTAFRRASRAGRSCWCVCSADSRCAGVEGSFHRDPWLASTPSSSRLLTGLRTRRSTSGDRRSAAIVTCRRRWCSGVIPARCRWNVAFVALTISRNAGRLFCSNLAIATAFTLDAAARRLQLPLTAAWVLLDPSLRSMLVPMPAVATPAIDEALLALRDVDGEGVLARWDDGHRVLWLARKPVVSTGFGSFLDAAGFAEERAAWDLPEDALVAWMASRRLDFVLAGATILLDKVGPLGGHVFAMEGSRARINPVFLRNVPIGRSAVGGSGIADADVPQLEHRADHATTSPVGGGPALPAVGAPPCEGAVLSDRRSRASAWSSTSPSRRRSQCAVGRDGQTPMREGRFASAIRSRTMRVRFVIGRAQVVRRSGTMEIAGRRPPFLGQRDRRADSPGA
jgi:hypothetical protein